MCVDTYRCNRCLIETDAVACATALRGRLSGSETNDSIMKGGRSF